MTKHEALKTLKLLCDNALKTGQVANLDTAVAMNKMYVTFDNLVQESDRRDLPILSAPGNEASPLTT